MANKSDNGNILTSSVLVLNKLYQAIKVITVRRAFILLYKNSAEVIAKYNGSYLAYNFTRWVENSNGPSAGDGLPAEAPAQADDDFIATPNYRIKVPRVIRLLIYDRFPKQELKLNRKNILARDDNRCQYCGKQYPVSKLSVDHIIPRSRGGQATWGNLVTCCSWCNTKKGGRLPKEVGMNLIRKPTVPVLHPLINTRIKDQKYQFWKEFLTGKEFISR